MGTEEKKTNEHLVWTTGLKYNRRKMEAAAQDRDGCREVV